jgi:hypothetical protein
VALTLILFVTEFWKWIVKQVSTGMKNSDNDVALHNNVCQEYRDESAVLHFELYKEL